MTFKYWVEFIRWAFPPLKQEPPASSRCSPLGIFTTFSRFGTGLHRKAGEKGEPPVEKMAPQNADLYRLLRSNVSWQLSIDTRSLTKARFAMELICFISFVGKILGGNFGLEKRYLGPPPPSGPHHPNRRPLLSPCETHPDSGLVALVAGDSAICGRLAALILRLRPAGLRFEEFRSPVKRGGLGLRFSNRSGLRPAAIWVCGHKPKFRSHSGIGCDFGAGWSCGWRCGPNR